MENICRCTRKIIIILFVLLPSVNICTQQLKTSTSASSTSGYLIPVLDLTKSLMGEFTAKKFAERIW
jgi:hypothetical protein